MRTPYFINKNTNAEYTPSPETLELVLEEHRQIHPEDVEWDNDFIPTLVTLCVQTLAKAFKDQPILDELDCADREHVLELLPTDLPLELVVPLINEEIYWQRRYQNEFGIYNQRKHVQWTWKAVYLEKYMSKRVEEAQPQCADEDTLEEITTLCNPYVTKLVVTQLQPWSPPLYFDPEEIPDVWPIQHINLEPILSKLENIVELDITFGLKDVWEQFRQNMFKVSVNDIKNLGRAILHLKNISILRIHRSSIEDEHAQCLMQHLVENETLKELDLSHCLIKDRGALCIAKLMTVHPALEILKLTNNKIEAEGARGIGFALTHDNCCPIIHLDLRLNPLGHEGVMGILRAIVTVEKPKELNLAAVFFEEDTPTRLGQMLGLNKSLKKLDISNNFFNVEGMEALVRGLNQNRMLEWLDIRECDIDDEYVIKINKLLLRNRLGLESEDKDDEVVQMEEVEVKSTEEDVPKKDEEEDEFLEMEKEE